MVRRRRNYRHHSGPHHGAAFGGPPGGKARAVVYARNVASMISRQSRLAMAFAEWADEANLTLNLGLEEGEASGWIDILSPKAPSKEVWLKVLDGVVAAAEKIGPAAKVSPLLDDVCKAMSLDGVDAEILQLMIDYQTSRTTDQLWDKLSSAEGEPSCLRLDPRFIGMLLGRDEETVAARLVVGSPLRESGLLRMEQNSGVSVLPRLLFLVRQPLQDGIDVKSALLGPQQKSTLTLDDFAHLGDDIHRVRELIRGALEERAKNVIVVLHGPPGTGKTELAKCIAADLSVPIHSVAETDEAGGEPSREERLGELQMAQKLLANAEPSILLFDEAEDLFGDARDLLAFFGARRQSGSKKYLHRILEDSTVPMIWTANSLEGFGPAVLRRMTACLEVRVPPVHVRTRIWVNAAVSEGVVVKPEELNRLSRQLPAAPALAASAMRAARLAGGDPDTISWALKGVAKAMNGGKALPVPMSTSQFDPALVNADVDLVALADRLCSSRAPKNISLLLSGLSGSGKSLFARYLAERMGLECLEKRASDLLGKYVGETEKRIAAAFQEAADQQSFLIFDEADSLLGDRRHADRPWQVSQVNEMLTHMECHPLPFVCTTNFMERVDRASMRRFLIKAQFGPLSPDQASIAFQRFFGIEPPWHMEDLDGLTPADFALVHRQAQIQGNLHDAEFLVASLAREQSAKGRKNKPIGFLH